MISEMTPIDLAKLNEEVTGCERCPRLREWCLKVASEKRKSFAEDTYWGLPVPNFGDPDAKGLIVGLAPAAHGANRTGRVFTGDRSGDWLYRALFRAGLANQPTSEHVNDGLALHGAYVSMIAHCAPPDNKPLPEEILNCRPFLERILQQREWNTILCLGSIAWNEVFSQLNVKPRPKFSHGAAVQKEKLLILGSYHPSQQNTFTGRLTEEMLDEVVQKFAEAIRAR